MGHTFSHAVQKSIMYACAQTPNLIQHTLKIFIAYVVWPKLRIFTVRKKKAAESGD